MNFYQKYRPKKIEDLDLSGVRATLSSLLSGKSHLQAFLFVGPRGAGKTSAARILAKTVNCEKTVAGEACGKCSACKSIENNQAVDIIEIDAASHRGIDDIRELRERVKLSPVSLKRKVYIIDEVHMLTKEAFNALLKTLEEPPEFVSFVLCTTEAHKVPETIESRCSKVIFTKASNEEVKRSLAKVIKAEGLKIDEEAVDLLASCVDGSFREGHKLLEQLASGGKKKLDLAYVEQVLGLVGAAGVKSLLTAVKMAQREKIIEIVKTMEQQGNDAVEVVKACLKVLRSEYEEGLLANKDVSLLTCLIGELSDLGGRLKQVIDPFLILEMVLLSACDEKVGEGEQIERVEQTVVSLEVAPAKKMLNTETVRGDGEIGKIADEWERLIAKMKDKNHSVAGLLRSAKPVRLTSDCLDVEVFYQFHKEQLEQEVRRSMIEEGAANLWGVKKISFNLGKSERVASKEDEELVRNAEEVFG